MLPTPPLVIFTEEILNGKFIFCACLSKSDYVVDNLCILSKCLRYEQITR